MTKLLSDIISQPGQLLQSLDHSLSAGMNTMNQAAKVLRSADRVYITGIGASWNAGLAIQAAFNETGKEAVLVDSSEFLHFQKPQVNATVIFLSRSGKSVEVVGSLVLCKAAGARTIAITNDGDSPLARGSDICLLTRVSFDHGISVNTYTSLILTGLILASCLSPSFSGTATARALEHVLGQVALKMNQWQDHISGSGWLQQDAPAYFLARGGSLASAFESMLLWHEGVKHAAVAMTTGSFRHGPQEVLVRGVPVGMWIDDRAARDHDFRLLVDLQKAGIKTISMGSDMPAGLEGLVLEIPAVPYPFQPIINIIPMQLAAEQLSRLKGEDCDSFRFCMPVVDREGGL